MTLSTALTVFTHFPLTAQKDEKIIRRSEKHVRPDMALKSRKFAETQAEHCILKPAGSKSNNCGFHQAWKDVRPISMTMDTAVDEKWRLEITNQLTIAAFAKSRISSVQGRMLSTGNQEYHSRVSLWLSRRDLLSRQVGRGFRGCPAVAPRERRRAGESPDAVYFWQKHSIWSAA